MYPIKARGRARHGRRGATVITYALLIGLVSVAGLATLGVMGETVDGLFSRVAGNLPDDSAPPVAPSPTPDIIAPVISEVTAPSATHGAGDSVEITLAASEPLVVSGSPELTIAINGNPRSFTFDRLESGAAVFTHQLVFDDAEGDGSLAILAYDFLPGEVRDAAGNDLNVSSAPSAVAVAIGVEASARIACSATLGNLVDSSAGCDPGDGSAYARTTAGTALFAAPCDLPTSGTVCNGTRRAITFDQAITACAAFTEGGQSDWVMPDDVQLGAVYEALVDPDDPDGAGTFGGPNGQLNSPANEGPLASTFELTGNDPDVELNYDDFPDADWYWTSVNDSVIPTSGRITRMDSGRHSRGGKTSTLSARCIRTQSTT